MWDVWIGDVVLHQSASEATFSVVQKGTLARRMVLGERLWGRQSQGRQQGQRRAPGKHSKYFAERR